MNKNTGGRWYRFFGFLGTLLVGFLVLLAVLLVGVRAVGLTPYAVLSGSMTPRYQVGDLVYVAKVPPEEIQVGDVITFVADSSLETVTHRVAEVNRQDRYFRTKGDANESVDGMEVIYENVVGTVRFSIPKLGYVSVYLSTSSGRYAGMAIGLALILVLFILPELFRPEREEES